MIKTVLRNLITNAIKFTDKCGKIGISVEKKPKNYLISVYDTGIGIKASVLKTLFNISENNSRTGTENEKGTGLGLLICQEFISAHNGEIWAESMVGQGSQFSFIIPKNINNYSNP